MAQRASPHPYLNVDEYLAFEETASVRHEYVGGALYALAGASDRHNEIVTNLVALIRPALRGTPCKLYANDMKLRLADEVFYYPDLQVSCDPTDRDRYVRYRPCALVEVLSPTTETIDRREKLFWYRQLRSLQAYILIDQDERHIERHFRNTLGQWENAELSGTGTVPFPCPDIELTLEDIYEGIDV
jgi:Uma2 family endonuclease